MVVKNHVCTQTKVIEKDRYIHSECWETCICIVRLKPNKTAAAEKDGLGFRQSCDLRFYISVLGSPSTANEQVLADDTILVYDGLKWTTTFWKSYLRVYMAALLLSSIPTLRVITAMCSGFAMVISTWEACSQSSVGDNTQRSRGVCVVLAAHNPTEKNLSSSC